MNRSFLIFAAFFMSAVSAYSQVEFREVSPQLTSPSIAIVHGSHVVSAPAAKNRRNKLVISIPGTGGWAQGMKPFDSVANLAGFHTISLDYKNEVITTVCRSSRDSSCYDSFRQEIVFGTPVSDSVRVDSANSLYNRINKLIQWLTKNRPEEDWGKYLSGDKIVWQMVTTVGHSQGAGHAAYLGKFFPLDRVIILAGPQDYLDNFNRPAPWVKLPSKTRPSKFMALLHVKDPFGFDKQLASCLLLSRTSIKDTVSDTRLNKGRGNIVVTHIATSNPHGSVGEAGRAGVWRYFLKK